MPRGRPKGSKTKNKKPTAASQRRGWIATLDKNDPLYEEKKETIGVATQLRYGNDCCYNITQAKSVYAIDRALMQARHVS